jgi:hypothetical protein
MPSHLITYDLDDVSVGENTKVFEALMKLPGAYDTVVSSDGTKAHKLPNTTLIVEVAEGVHPSMTTALVRATIAGVGAQADRIGVIKLPTESGSAWFWDAKARTMPQ